MKFNLKSSIIFSFCFFPLLVFSELKPESDPTLKEKYDFFENEALVFKLIEDNEVTAALNYLEKIPTKQLKPENRFFFEALKSSHKGFQEQALDFYLKSLNLTSQPLVLHLFLKLWHQTFQNNPQILCQIKEWSFLKSLPSAAENSYVTLSKSCLLGKKSEDFYNLNEQLLSSTLKPDTESSELTSQAYFEIFYMNVQFLLQHQLVQMAYEKCKKEFTKDNKISIFHKLQIVESFKGNYYHQEAINLLEILRLIAPDNEDVKLSLAQMHLSRENYYTSSLFLAEMKNPNSLIESIIAELMNKTNRSQMAIFYRSLIPDNKEYLKNH
ncbi:MAG: hypothetical protein L6Q37_11845, partial [Bdellovibrionaceae bacterium]|nr:hypothetical protein [Pseudobdellovibrionaceae bacterium]